MSRICGSIEIGPRGLSQAIPVSKDQTTLEHLSRAPPHSDER